jgi:DNA polymerase III sliding clamp (beta) subunit (PCNA family)
VAYTKIKFDQEFKALIPGVAVMYLTHLLKEEGVEISQSESLTRFTQDQYELIANNIKQPYANYQNVFPKEVLTYWQFNLEELRSAVKSAKVVASENNGRIMLADTLISKEGEEPKSGVLIYARSETSEFRKTISLVKSKGISQKLAINAKYLLDALEQIGGAEGVVFGINEALKPIILRSSQKEDPYRELIMPMVLENSSRPPEDQEEEKKEEGAVDGADIRTALKKCQE